MRRIARFEKVSEGQFIKDWEDMFGSGSFGQVPAVQDKNGQENEKESEKEKLRRIYGEIRLPRRATRGSAGYDFFLPCPISLEPGEMAVIPTGIRVQMCEAWMLQIYPRSGLGFKYRLQLNNTVGIIDSDYFFSDNEGHILIKLLNDGREGKRVDLASGAAFAQGVFVEYGITEDDEAGDLRNGGFGSTDGEKYEQ